MKAYQNWVMGPVSKDWIRDEFTGAEAGWRAALEWAKTQRSAGMEEDGSLSVCDWVTIDRINEELNS